MRRAHRLMCGGGGRRPTEASLPEAQLCCESVVALLAATLLQRARCELCGGGASGRVARGLALHRTRERRKSRTDSRAGLGEGGCVDALVEAAVAEKASAARWRSSSQKTSAMCLCLSRSVARKVAAFLADCGSETPVAKICTPTHTTAASAAEVMAESAKATEVAVSGCSWTRGRTSSFAAMVLMALGVGGRAQVHHLPHR